MRGLVTPQDYHGIAFRTCRTNKPVNKALARVLNNPVNFLGENHELYAALFNSLSHKLLS